jgi:flagellar basal-body rod protein FlgG
MAAEQARTDAASNNVANIDTDGYKRTSVSTTDFGNMLVQLVDPTMDGIPVIGQIGTGATVESTTRDNSPGPIQETGNPMDVALTGAGQFTFQGPNGPAYTRLGAFHRDNQGQLVTAQGYPLLVSGKPVGAGAREVTVAQDGTVLLDGKAAGTLDIQGGDGKPLALKSLEHSNVDLAQEMTDMIIAMRAFQANQRALAMQDNTLNRTVNEIGKV